jgi:hypothetical protein
MPQSMMNFQENFLTNCFLTFAFIFMISSLKLIIIVLNCMMFSYHYPIMIYFLIMVLCSLYGIIIMMMIYISIVWVIDMIC